VLHEALEEQASSRGFISQDGAIVAPDLPGHRPGGKVYDSARSAKRGIVEGPKGHGMTVEETLKKELIRRLPRSHPACVRPGTSLMDTLRIMREEGAGAVLVCDGSKLVGIFTERDVLNKLFGAPVDDNLPIDRLMTPDPQVLRLDDPLGKAVRLMTERGYRHVPLVDENGARAGMIAARDIITYIAEHYPAEVVNLPPSPEQEFTTPEGG
jgi:CBS domain-containing protein